MSRLSIVIFLSFCFFARTQSQWAVRQYLVEKDFFTGIKAGEFSIYDQSGRTLLFRLESRYAFTQTAELYAYPGKQLVASIRNIWSPWSKPCRVTWRSIHLLLQSTMPRYASMTRCSISGWQEESLNPFRAIDFVTIFATLIVAWSWITKVFP